MITYVDTSSLLKLVIDEDGSDQAELIWDSADVLASVSLVVVEGRAALAAARRDGRLDARQHSVAAYTSLTPWGHSGLAPIPFSWIPRIVGVGGPMSNPGECGERQQQILNVLSNHYRVRIPAATN